jgi:hypothetical protein
MKTMRLVLTVCILMVWIGSFPGDSQEKKEDANVPVVPIVPVVSADKPEPLTVPDQGPALAYTIDAQFIPSMRKIIASETIDWRNTSSQPVESLQFHLYYNAFRNVKSTFFQEWGYYKKPKKELDNTRWGEVKLQEIELAGGTNLTGNITYISPDDGNTDDRTVMSVKLPAVVSPGQSVKLKISFTLTIPQIFLRTGVEGEYYFIGQWFPKLGVLLDNGQWRCHQFHFNSEFFADYADYRVKLTVPGKFVVGASGNLVDKEKNADDSITYRYEEKNIHDFAWVAYPYFTKITEEIKLKDAREPVTVELLLPPGHRAAGDRYMNVLKYTLDFFARTLFPYPYRKLTLVDPPLEGFGSGAMEYPTLVTLGYHPLILDSFKLPELIAIHELAHQYFYGIVGNDESREAWLDEGVSDFYEKEIAELYFKDSRSLLDIWMFKVDAWEPDRDSYASSIPVNNVNEYSWKFLNSDYYNSNVYSRAAIFFRSMKGLVGKERMYDFFKYYAQKYAYKHPTSEDFIDSFNAFMNEDFNWAFDLYIRGESGVDNAVYSIDSFKISSNPLKYRNEAVFVRKEGYFPVDISIKLENGKEIKSSWREKEKWKKMIFEDTSPIKQALIDPFYKVPMDKNFLNNSKVSDPDTSGIDRLALKAGFIIQDLLGSLVF